MNKEYTNSLIKEKSPYLLQHAHNPINWYSWEDVAFNKARCENKPIFLSIGYSTCHWCHVMAHESFEDIEVAKYLNENYICIKVDREERPDIDEIYMNVCISLTGSGGWPLSAFIDSEKRPFYAGTYFPKDHFLNLTKHLKNLWDKEPEIINSNANIFIERLSELDETPGNVNSSIIHKAYKQYHNNFDYKYGGIKGTPKFPTPHNLIFLLAYSYFYDGENILNFCKLTLDSMRKGGIYDQLGYGFSRYSTDEKWLVPHFEKMLYDNALLMNVYAKAYEITKKESYLNTAKEVSIYLQRQMKDRLGGLYTAEDADSEGSEGTFYTFLKEEIDNLLEDKAIDFNKFYNITEDGNFEGENILNIIGNNLSDIDKFEKERKILFDYQNQREHPFIDKKILLDNNALAISAYCSLYKETKDSIYLNLATEIYDFNKQYMVKYNKLYSSYIDGVVKYLGYARDYAYFINALIDLNQVTYDNSYMKDAIDLSEIMFNNFYDQENGGYYQTDKDGEVVLVKKKEIYDGAIPSSNSVMIYNNLRLFEITNEYKYYDAAIKSFNLFANIVNKYPLGYMFYNYALLAYTEGFTIIRIIAKDLSEANEYLKFINNNNKPFSLVVYEKPSKYFKLLDNLPTVYVCFGKECKNPVNNINSFINLLKEPK